MPNRAPDFRWYPASALGFAFSDNDAKVTFAVEEQGPDGPIEQVGVVMSHRTLKLFGALIRETIEHYETQSGDIIPLDPAKIEDIRKNFITPQKPTASSPPSGRYRRVARPS